MPASLSGAARGIGCGPGEGAFGFRGAEDYYHRASAMRVIDRIGVPALVITAEDDPFVPSQPFRDPKVAGNPHIDLRICRHGGHCGFVGPQSPQDDGYWAETQIVEFVVRARRVTAESDPASLGRRATHKQPGTLSS